MDRELNNLHIFVGWASRPFFLDGRDAHPTRTIKIVSYLILIPKSISDAGWGQFCTMLKYKSEWAGKTYIEVDRFYPSSKTCNNCLNRVDSLSLDIRSWQCPKCGEKHDRDINAAQNIRDEGLRILTVGHTVTASGGRVRPSKGTAFTRHLPVNEES